jgi:hypothetical protein
MFISSEIVFIAKRLIEIIVISIVTGGWQKIERP